MIVSVLSLVLLFASSSRALTGDDFARAIHKLELPAAPSNSDPDFPIFMVLKAYVEDQKQAPDSVVKTLEPVLTKKLFQKTVTSSDENFRSYGTWRDLAYLVLSRAYYEIGDYPKALNYLSGIPERSPLKDIAEVQKTWVLLGLNQLENAELALRSLEQRESISDETKKQIALQRSYLFLKSGKPEEALKITERLNFGILHELESLRYKIQAQSYFRQFETSLKKSFAVRQSLLKKSIDSADKVHPSFRDQHYAYFAAEAFWQMASQLRVEDPVKYQSDTKMYLERADKIISPWAERTAKERKNWLSEEAMFLAAVILWEGKRFDRAVPRLLSVIDVYPKTEYREDIFQLVGDHFYDTAKFDQALTYYRKLAESGQEEKASYGTYKASWSFYNLNQKFKGLRHLQRLVLYYRKAKATSADPGNLIQESEKDMLLMLAELLSFKEASNELDYINYSGDEWFRIREDLAISYGKLGRSDEAVQTWVALLEKSPGHGRHDHWLTQLLQAHLNAAQRTQISSSLQRYKNPKTIPVKNGDLEKKIVFLQLTLHREGSKTDDVDVWKAADMLYEVVSSYLPNLENGDFWYFGAQRLEKRGKPWSAVSWYQKAAMVKGYEGAEDAAITPLRIAQTEIDALSLKENVPADSYKFFVDSMSWFLKHFKHRPERSFAEKLYFEALYRAANLASARDYITANASGKSSEFWQNILNYYRYLYEGKKWEEVFHLSDHLLKKGHIPENLTPQYITARQESAFERAFELEKESQQMALARTWYDTCVRVSQSPELKLKAWHNKLLTWKPETESDSATLDYESFQKSGILRGAELSFDDKTLLYNIHLAGNYLFIPIRS